MNQNHHQRNSETKESKCYYNNFDSRRPPQMYEIPRNNEYQRTVTYGTGNQFLVQVNEVHPAYNKQQRRPSPRRPGAKRSHERTRTTPSTSQTSSTGNSPVSKRLGWSSKNSSDWVCKTPGHPKNQPKSIVKCGQKPNNTNDNKQESRLKIENNLKEARWNALFTEALKNIDNCKPGEEVNILLSTLQSSRVSWIKLREMIYNDLYNLLEPLLIQKLSLFGSTLTGLDFFGSDLDFHVQLKTPPADKEEVKRVINHAGRLAGGYRKNFRTIIKITSARVPIIRLLHQQTNVTCDVNFTSQFGYYNSCFIATILGFDTRIRDLAVILKLWSKSHKISERMIISNYCLLVLLIFYLQNLEQPMLDSIKNNQTSRNPIILDEKFKWNVFFNDHINLTRNNQLTLRQLLLGFFQYYDTLDFVNNIVCIYSGKLIRRDEFEKHPDFENYREVISNDVPPLKFDSPQHFVVQDGFELNLNIGIKSAYNVTVFFDTIKASLKNCLDLKDEPFSKLLTKIFTDIIPQKKKNSATKEKVREKKFMITIHSVAEDMKMCQEILTAEDNSKTPSIQEQEKFFFNQAVEGTIDFLRDIYHCTVVPDNEQSQSDAMTKKFRLTLDVDTVTGRKRIDFKSASSVAAEIDLTRKMIEQKRPMELDCTITITTKNNGKSVEFEIVDNVKQKKTSLSAFYNSLSINIFPALKFYLKKKLQLSKPQTN